MEDKALSRAHPFTPILYSIADLAFWLSGWELSYRFGWNVGGVAGGLAVKRLVRVGVAWRLVAA
jgi:hypothetical protein